MNDDKKQPELEVSDTSSESSADTQADDTRLADEVTLEPQNSVKEPFNKETPNTETTQPVETTQPIKTTQQVEATGSSDAEDIRQLLAEVPRSSTGTVTFTKIPTYTTYKRKQRWRGFGFLLLALLIPLMAITLYVRQQLSPVSPGVVEASKLEIEPGWGTHQLATLLERTGLLRFYMKQQLAPVSPTSTPTEFEVIPGWGATQVANALEQAGLIRNARMFAFYVRGQNLDRNIGEGLYDLDPAMGSTEIASLLNKGGRPRVIKVIIPEGFRMKDIAKTLASANVADERTFLELFQKGERPSFIAANKPLEGYLFPASYEIPVKSTPEEVVQFFLKRFKQELTPEVEAALKERGWTVPGWVTLASVVQAEAANTAEMPVIAGVFLNRLEEGMPLQSDPTVAYGLGKDLPELDRSAGDFEADNEWNTYTRSGLPTTPINNPGLEALQAVLNAKRENEDGEKYFYFLHGTDNGQPVFKPNINFEDHLRDSELYLQ